MTTVTMPTKQPQYKPLSLTSSSFQMKNLPLILNVTTLVIFLILAVQTCLALPVEVLCLTVGIVLLGSLGYVATSELWVLWQLESHGQVTRATVVRTCQNRVGWQRLQVEMAVSEGTLRKWTDAAASSMCRHCNVGDVVTVTLSKDWQHCRLQEPSSSWCKVGTVMTVLSFGAILATGKAFLLVFLLVTRRACGSTCHTVRCEDEFETRALFACLVGATVYTDLCVFVRERYYDSFPSSLTDADVQLSPVVVEPLKDDACHPLGTKDLASPSTTSEELPLV